MKRAMKESAVMQTLPLLGGVDVMRARFVTHSFSRHFHEGYALGCIEDGAMRFRYQGENVVASRGQINLVVPGETHDGHGALETGWAYRMFYLKPEALRNAAAELTVRPDMPHFRSGVVDDRALAACLLRTHRALERPHASSLEKETRLHWLLVQWISRHAEQRGFLRSPGAEHAAVAMVREVIEDRYEEDLSLGELAGLCRLSPFHLTRVFARDMGLSPHEYLVQTRVERARLAMTGNERIADVAARCGFADQPHLTRAFKRQYGVTPGRYRKMLQNS